MKARLFRFQSRAVDAPPKPADLSTRYELPERLARTDAWFDAVGPDEQTVARRRKRRFKDYLASSFRAGNRRRGRVSSLQRNRRILVALFIAAVLFALVYHFVR